MLITPAYAAIFALLFVALSLRTIRLRRRARVGIGSGGDAALERAARVHSNFAEYVPFAIVLIYFMEIETAGNAWVHGLCLVLLTGRLLHAWGVSQVKENYRFRVAGMTLTFAAILSAAFLLLYAYASSQLQY
jgi:uncharacterized membrane protein YecN with MAPEG domain